MSYQSGDPVATTHLRREIAATFHGTIPNSQPSAHSDDLLCRVKIDGVFYLKRLSEIRAYESKTTVVSATVSDDASVFITKPIDGIFDDEVSS